MIDIGESSDVFPKAGDILGAIDGTGEDNDNVYDNDFATSFVHRLKYRWDRSSGAQKNVIYKDGPSAFDTRRPVGESANEIYLFILVEIFRASVLLNRKLTDIRTKYDMSTLPTWPTATNQVVTLGRARAPQISQRRPLYVVDSEQEQNLLKSTPYPRIFLAGYSRGAAGVIHVARLLQKRGITVYCLLLYDAVNRTFELNDVDTIPSNVQFCYHAVRDPAMSSRVDFGTMCGRKADDPDRTIFVGPKTFKCTHGGMGGVPWTKGSRNLTLKNASFDQVGVGAAIGGIPGAELAEILAPPPPSQGQQYIQEDYTVAPTNVTLNDDAIISQTVGQWMNSNFESALKRAPLSFWEIDRRQ